MKFEHFASVSLLAATVAARSVLLPQQQPIKELEERFLIELEPGHTAWVTEDEKWQIRRVSLDMKALRTLLEVSKTIPRPPRPRCYQTYTNDLPSSPASTSWT